jgi:hypothetical protein
LFESPRGDNKDTPIDNATLYAHSEDFEATNSNKIDYFISHSWNDDAEIKCQVLKAFSLRFKASNNREPTYWFDKVCIDQEKVNNPDYYALLVLPINIGACRKVLVLLGESYIRRIWCLWELFCLFLFCNKDLALDRVEVELLDSLDSHESAQKACMELEILTSMMHIAFVLTRKTNYEE